MSVKANPCCKKTFSTNAETIQTNEKQVDIGKLSFYIYFQHLLKKVLLMKTSDKEFENRTMTALINCLENIPFIKKREMLPAQPDGPDLVMSLDLPHGKQILAVEIRNNGQPRIAREAVNKLLRYRNVYPDSYCLFMAPYISPQATEVCIKDGIGYLDLAGNCFISFEQVYISREGIPNPFSAKRYLRSLFSPKAARVLRGLLCNPKSTWKMKELADEAKVSLGQVANVKKLLEDREWIKSTPEGLLLTEPERLLSEWAGNYTYKKNRVRNFYTLKSVAEIESELARVCSEREVEYALTGFSGAARFAPMVRYQKAMAYIGTTKEDIAAALNLKEVQSGANVTLLTPYDEGVFYGVKEFEGVRVASPVQIYLDLLGLGRGEEAADAMLREVIRPTW